MGKSLVIKGADFSACAVNEKYRADWYVGEYTDATKSNFGKPIHINSAAATKQSSGYIPIVFSIVISTSIPGPKYAVHFLDANKNLIGFYNESGNYSGWIEDAVVDVYTKAPAGTAFYAIECDTKFNPVGADMTVYSR